MRIDGDRTGVRDRLKGLKSDADSIKLHSLLHSSSEVIELEIDRHCM